MNWVFRLMTSVFSMRRGVGSGSRKSTLTVTTGDGWSYTTKRFVAQRAFDSGFLVQMRVGPNHVWAEACCSIHIIEGRLMRWRVPGEGLVHVG